MSATTPAVVEAAPTSLLAAVLVEVDELAELSPPRLAALAGCACPDRDEEAGRSFLVGVADAVAVLLGDELRALDADADADDILATVTAWREGDAPLEIADGAPSVYTFTMWKQFVELAAWQTDVSDFGDMGDDLSRAAGWALYMIARDLVDALVERVAEAVERVAESFEASLDVYDVASEVAGSDARIVDVSTVELDPEVHGVPDGVRVEFAGGVYVLAQNERDAEGGPYGYVGTVYGPSEDGTPDKVLKFIGDFAVETFGDELARLASDYAEVAEK